MIRYAKLANIFGIFGDMGKKESYATCSPHRFYFVSQMFLLILQIIHTLNLLLTKDIFKTC